MPETNVEANSLATVRAELERIIPSLSISVAVATSAAGGDPGDCARVCHAADVLKELASEMERVAKASRESARERLLQVMSDAGQPTIVVETLDGLRRLSSTKALNYPHLIEGVSREAAAEALRDGEGTGHLAELKYDVRSVRSWAKKSATDAGGAFDASRLPAHVRDLFEFSTKQTISNRKA